MRAQLLVVMLIGLAGTAPASAQGPEVIYSRQPVFRIPFQIETGEQPRLREVQLYVLDEASRSWKLHQTVGPDQRHFPFRAEREGLHQFMVRTIDKESRAFPPRVEGAPPGLKVHVDTIAPAVILKQLTSRDDQVGLEWEIHDDNLEASSFQLEYRPQSGGEWQPLVVNAHTTGTKFWTPMHRGPVEARLRVRDRAENQGSATVVLSPASSSEPGKRDATSPDSPRYTSGAGTPAPSAIKVVNTQEMNLSYSLEEVGPSGVSLVELWGTRDGKTWQRMGEDQDKTSPFNVEFPGEGLHGLTLVVRSGVGLGDRPPQLGDAPQLWVEVDLTKPTVHLNQLEAGRGAEAGNLTITWKAEDKNLTSQPISLYYAEHPEGPWNSIVSNLENSGRHVWRTPPGTPFRFHVRVEAIDRGGNIGRADSPKPVIVDLSQPRGRLLGVEATSQP